MNSHGTLFGGFGTGSWVPGLWRNGEWTAIQADKQPATYPFGDVTDDEVLIGNYRVGSDQRAARWFCAQQG
ncbi:hypothetical protein JOF56_000726 [Kibdelosporangium banguiense]|uniref:Uncharacterized protein n=1 Tax=Kibdelosporangium banguiense TaxID=1365924 RepID=A0ABS4T7E0_9PSEU|nr:hypothetical protein [Kibdelosporangium banguiense]MBP2320341.1 hypothetical protein [Kibdelosporangium banguiense]